MIEKALLICAFAAIAVTVTVRADGARHMPSSIVVVVDGDTLALDKRTIRLRGMGAKR